MNRCRFLFLILLFAMPTYANAFMLPTAKLTVKVVDEQGTPIKDAYVVMAFVVPAKSGWGTGDVFRKGNTDGSGLFTADSECSSIVGFSAEKEGFYHSDENFHFKSRSLLNRWEPWNPTVEVVLKKKRNPVAMYAYYTDWMKIPAFDKPVGYDLEKRDWVAPYGKGTTNDFIFTIHGDITSWRDYECSYTLSFENDGDGIQEYVFPAKEQSYYKWPFDATTDGYVYLLQKSHANRPNKPTQSTLNDKANYLFRVRTKKDRQGRIISAMYGKVSGEIDISSESIKFHYYFNPDGTRNLEEDDKRNLFEDKARK
ncbi:MAG: hypothetical protein HZA20_03195 [Nitrospirae bacterium]|nr:hypothetical protein [Nitrospirota bacterium]